MKNIFLGLIASIFSFSAMAGDGGFLLRNCVSKSGRTTLTVFEDLYSAAEVKTRVVFAIDGQFLTYQPRAGKCEYPDGSTAEEDCLRVSIGDNFVGVSQGDTALLSINFDGNSATIGAGFYEPRPFERGNVMGSIGLTCKTFKQHP